MCSIMKFQFMFNYFLFSSLNNLMFLIFISIILQVLVFEMVEYISYFYFLMLEMWVFFLILFFKPSKLDLMFFVMMFYMIFFTSLLVSLLLISEIISFMPLLYFFITVKVLFFMMVLSMFLDYESLILNKFMLMLYTFNFKIFLFIYVMISLEGNNLEMLAMIVLDFSYMYMLFWVISSILMVKVLILGSLESYLFLSLNFSHYLMFSSCFLNIKVFLFCAVLDSFICILMAQLLCFGYNSLSESFLGFYTPLFIFLMACHVFGVPPFPSFLLEVCLMFMFFQGLNMFFKMLFLFLIYVLLCLNFMVIFSLMGKVLNNKFFYVLFGDSVYLMTIMMFGVFLVCFLSISVMFSM